MLRGRRPRRTAVAQRLRGQAHRPRTPRRRTAPRLRARGDLLAGRFRQRLLRPSVDQGDSRPARRPARRPDEPRRLQRPVPPARPVRRLPGTLGRDARRPRPRPRARARSPAGRVGRHARPARRRPPAPGQRHANARHCTGGDAHAREGRQPARAGARGPRAGLRQPRLQRPRPGRRQARRSARAARRRPDAGDLRRSPRRRPAGRRMGRAQRRSLRRVPRRLGPLRPLRRLPPQRADADRGTAAPGRRLPAGRVARHPHDDADRLAGKGRRRGSRPGVAHHVDRHRAALRHRRHRPPLGHPGPARRPSRGAAGQPHREAPQRRPAHPRRGARGDRRPSGRRRRAARSRQARRGPRQGPPGGAAHRRRDADRPRGPVHGRSLMGKTPRRALATSTARPTRPRRS